MRLRKIHAAILIALVIVVGLAGGLSAQADSPGNPTILQAIQAVKNTLDGAVTTLNGVVTTLNGLVAAQTPGSTLFTPAVVAFAPDTFICTATNVAATNRTIRVQLINGNTAATLVENSTTGISVGPGLSTAAAIAAASTRAFCKVTVGNGNKTEVRGVLALFESGTSSDKLTIAAE
jgi:hypothetical protein